MGRLNRSSMWTQGLPNMLFMLSLGSLACGDDDSPPEQAYVAICHRAIDDPDDASIIEVLESSVQEHLDHGDSLRPCGALVSVTMESTIGVLIDELPPSVRERAAQDLLSKNEEFWRKRIEAQLRLTLYQLTYRPFFYPDRLESVGVLWLPPKQNWNISLDEAGPIRTTIDDHDYVAVNYILTGTLLSDQESTCAAEAALCDVGGKWYESFKLPVDADPQLMVARMRYACACEEGTPFNNVFGPTSWFFYNQYTEACDGDAFPCPCHITEPTSESCFDALDNHIGSVRTGIQFERIPWSSTVASQVRSGELKDTSELIAVAEDLEETWLTYRYIGEDSCEILESCVEQAGWRRLLNFSANSVNLGKEPIHIGALDEGNPYIESNAFHLSECHGHYHFNHYADYRFGDESGHKQGFCLIGTSRITNTEHTPLHHPYYTCDHQGIPPGWGDEYTAGLSCQWVDVTDLDFSAGDVIDDLVFRLNPQEFLCEGTAARDESGNMVFETPRDNMGECLFRAANGECEGRPVCEFAPDYQANNVVTTTVTIPDEGSMVTAPCTHEELGPARDCGFAKQADALGCTPGETVELSCTLSDPAAAPQALRVCESSMVLGHGIACEALQALAMAVVAPELGPTTVTFTCPGRRDDFEPGGQYAMYVAPLLATDALATVSCQAP